MPLIIGIKLHAFLGSFNFIPICALFKVSSKKGKSFRTNLFFCRKKIFAENFAFFTFHSLSIYAKIFDFFAKNAKCLLNKICEVFAKIRKRNY